MRNVVMYDYGEKVNQCANYGDVRLGGKGPGDRKAGHCIGSRLQRVGEGVVDCIFRPYLFGCFTLVVRLGARIHRCTITIITTPQ